MNTDSATPSLPDYEDKTLAPHKVGLVEAELDKANIRQEFGWYVVISPDGSEIKVSKLVHVPSAFYFIFNCDEHDSMSYRMCPGLNVRTESAHPGSWEDVFRAFQRWLSILESNLDVGVSRISGDMDEFSLLVKNVFNRDLPKHVSLAQKEGIPLSLVMLDIDRFKTAINDVHGHHVGDEVLKFVSDVIKRATGVKGGCYRWGGDEIAILLLNHSIDEATALAERIRREIEEATISTKALKVTVSLGVAELPLHVDTAQELQCKADAALYDAKQFRNLVRVSGEPFSAPEPRVVNRRLPSLSQLSEGESERIRTEWFRAAYVVCPRDQSQLRILEIENDENVTPDLHVSCPLCGLSEQIRARRH